MYTTPAYYIHNVSRAAQRKEARLQQALRWEQEARHNHTLLILHTTSDSDTNAA